MKKAELKELLQQEGNPCVSIIISTELKSFSEKENIQVRIKKSVVEAEKKLRVNYDQKTVEKIVGSIESLINQVDLKHLQKGIGVFVSPNYSKLILFPFAVKDNITINNVFQLYEIEDTLDKMFNYLVVLLSKGSTRIFSGTGNILNEIKDDNFPQYFENEYEVHRAPKHSFYGNIEVSTIEHKREESYFREIDKLLAKYVKDQPLVLLGVVENLSKFKLQSKHIRSVIAEFEGNFDRHTLSEISEFVWPEVEKYYTENLSYINHF